MSNNSNDLAVIERLPGNVKVVNQILWCGRTFALGLVAGCASGNSTSLSVIRSNPNIEGRIWAHEFGHKRNLPYRNIPNFLMFRSAAPDHDAVNQFESNSLR